MSLYVDIASEIQQIMTIGKSLMVASLPFTMFSTLR